MKRAIHAAVLLLLLTGPLGDKGTAAPALPRIMSLKVCTDLLLLDLLPPDRIAAVTFMAREPVPRRLWPHAQAIPIHHGTAEEILSLRPDIILTDPFLSPTIRAVLARTGARIIEVPPANSFSDIRNVTRAVARALNVTAQGERIIARMDADLAALAANRPRHPVTVAGWGGGGFVPGSGGLFDAMLTAAGARNVERAPFAYYDVETLLAKNPDVILQADTYAGMRSLRDEQDMHPALLKRYAGRRIAYSPLYGCGVPALSKVTRELQAALKMARP